MPEPVDDYALLRQYADADSDAAFATLVGRHTDMVYSAALRQVRHVGTAEEVTQAVFILLMRKAARLPPGTIVAAWLFKATRYTALNAVRADLRRRGHERKAGVMAQQAKREPKPGGVSWADVEPMLDEAVARLSAKDRDAIVMRFFERRSLAEVGHALDLSEGAAQMRVHRALEKLRAMFGRRGIVLTAAAVGVMVGANATRAASPQLPEAVRMAVHSRRAFARADSLAEQTARTMAWQHARPVAALCVTAVLIAGGLVGLAATLDQWQRNQRNAAVSADVPKAVGFLHVMHSDGSR